MAARSSEGPEGRGLAIGRILAGGALGFVLSTQGRSQALGREENGAPQRRGAAPLLEALEADGPLAQNADKLMLFGQFAGDWECDVANYGSDGSKKTTKAEWHLGWILEGRALQDVWIAPPRSEGGERSEYGTAIRTYDPKIDAWRMAWVGPGKGSVVTFIGRKTGDDIVLEAAGREGPPLRWIFSEITPNSFHWRAVVSDDAGKTWTTVQEMSVRRRPQGRNGPEWHPGANRQNHDPSIVSVTLHSWQDRPQEIRLS